MSTNLSLVRLRVLMCIFLACVIWYRRDYIPLDWLNLANGAVVRPAAEAVWTNGTITFRSDEWRSSFVPGPDDQQICVHVSQITVHDAELVISQQDGTVLVGKTSILEGCRVRFEMDGHRYTLSVLELVNSLSKPNSAVLQIKRTPHSRQPQFEVDQDIERLIQHVEASDLTFVLEGTTVAGSEAGAQLRRKWRYAGTRFTNVNDFIERIANRSPATAEPYLAELVDGSNLRMRDWLREQWKELQSTSIQ